MPVVKRRANMTIGFLFPFLVGVVVIVNPIHLALAPLEPRGINSNYCCSLDGAGRYHQTTWRRTTKHELIVFLKNEGGGYHISST
jgi:hypothetical protein